MTTTDIIIYLFIIAIWTAILYGICLGIAGLIDILIEWFGRKKNKPEDLDYELEDNDAIEQLLVSLQGMRVSYVNLDDVDDTYLSIYGEKALTITLEPTNASRHPMKNGCLLTPAFTWHITDAQTGEKIDLIEALQGKELDLVEVVQDAILCTFEDVTLTMLHGKEEFSTCYVEKFLNSSGVQTITLKSKYEK